MAMISVRNSNIVYTLQVTFPASGVDFDLDDLGGLGKDSYQASLTQQHLDVIQTELLMLVSSGADRNISYVHPPLHKLVYKSAYPSSQLLCTWLQSACGSMTR